MKFINKNRQSLQDQQGFTLIEIMIVIVIIGVLASLVIPRIIDRPDQARAIKAKQDMRTMEASLQLYKLDNFTYPTQQQGLLALVKRPTQGAPAANWSGPYLERLPKDPWGGEYYYRMPGEYGSLDLFTLGADGVEGGVDSASDIGSWNQE